MIGSSIFLDICLDIYVLAILISVIVFVAVGINAGRAVKKLDDYFVAGRRAPTLLIIGTLVASVFSTSIFLGEAGFTYDGQLGPYLLMPGVAVIGYVYGALFLVLFCVVVVHLQSLIFLDAGLIVDVFNKLLE